MFFDEAPKTNRSDLYGFQEEQESFLRALREGARLITIVGLRRTGKSSLLMTCLNESRQPYLIVDAGSFAQSPVISRVELFSALEKSLNQLIEARAKWADRILKALKFVRGVHISAGPVPSVSIAWGRTRQDSADLPALFASLGKMADALNTRFVIAFDEAQEFRRLAGHDLPKLLAHVYDYVPSLQLVLTGSQVGFLHEFLGVENPRAPLYGRARVEIRTPRLKPDQARDFLLKGSSQVGINPDRVALDAAVEKLDGIVGWLTFLGATVWRNRRFSEEMVEQTVKEASRLAASEVTNFLEIRRVAKTRYIAMLTRLAQSPSTWSTLKRSLEAAEGRQVSDYIFNTLLSNLVNASLVAKNSNGLYTIEDPVLIHAINTNAL